MKDQPAGQGQLNASLILFFFLILFLFPLLGQTITLWEGTKAGAVLLGFYLLGSVTLGWIPFYKTLSTEFKVGLNIFLGGTLAFFMLPIINFVPLLRWFFWGLVVVLLAFELRRKRIVFSAVPIWLWSLLVLFILYNFSNHNYLEYLSRIPTQRINDFQDYYWFTAMIASLRDGLFHTSIYEQGTGVYHHILGLFPIAALAEFAQIPTHVANWGMIIPFTTFLAFLSVIELGQFFLPKLKNNNLFPLTLAAVLILAAPIHPLYALKLNFTVAVWNGNGYTPPTLAPWNASYILITLLALLTFKGSLKDRANQAFFILLIPALLWAKVTNVIFVIILGVISLFQFAKGDRKLFYSLAIAGIPTLVLIKFFYSHSSASFTFEPGYLINYFGSLAFGEGTGGIKGILTMIVVMIIWGGIRWIGFFGLPKHKENFERTALLSGLGAGLLVAIAIGCLFKIYSHDLEGNIVDDSSFDILQFARSFFIYLSIFASIGLTALLLHAWENRVLKLSYFTLAIGWAVIALANFSIRASKVPSQQKQLSWSTEVVKELKQSDFELVMMKSSLQYSGQFLSAHDIGPWYLSIKNREGGCTYSYVNLDKLELLDELMLPSSSPKESTLNFFRSEGIDLLVATPDTKKRFEELEKLGLVHQKSNKSWLYGF